MLPDFWHEMCEPSDIYASLAPLLFIAAASGITPLSMTGRKGRRKLKVTRFGLFVTFCNTALMAGCYAKTIHRDETIVGYFIDNEISKFGDNLQLMTGIIGITVVYGVSIRKRQAIVAVIRNLANVDEQLLALGVKVKYKKLLHYAHLHLAFKSIFYVSYLVGSYKLLASADVYAEIFAYMAFFFPYLITTVIVVMYSCVTRLINDRFVVLNKVLVNMIEQFVNKNDVSRKKSIPFTREPSDKFMSWVTVLKTHDETIEEVAHIHDMLCDLATITNDFFTVQMLAITGIAFLIIVFDAYYVLGTYLGLASFRATAFIIFFSSQLILHAIEVCVIVHGSSEAVSQSQMTSIYVHKLLNLTKVDSLKDVLYKLSLQLIHRKVVFDAAGFFVLDRTLFFTICGATTTYLIILLQFSSENDTNMEKGDETMFSSILNSSLVD